MIWVFKLGGSLQHSPQLLNWLRAAEEGAGRLVLVSGGGGFAEQVRYSQRYWNLTEDCAHHMALLAMEQYARLLLDLCPRLVPVRSYAALRNALRRDRVPVWMPRPMAENWEPQNWTNSSDSLALRLALELDAAWLLLLKSAVPVHPVGPPADLVDAHFMPLLNGATKPPGLAWLEPGQFSLLAACLRQRGEVPPGLQFGFSRGILKILPGQEAGTSR